MCLSEPRRGKHKISHRLDDSQNSTEHKLQNKKTVDDWYFHEQHANKSSDNINFLLNNLIHMHKQQYICMCVHMFKFSYSSASYGHILFPGTCQYIN
jgi:hypothetical protein